MIFKYAANCHLTAQLLSGNEQINQEEPRR
jgi:hypothetical protein